MIITNEIASVTVLVPYQLGNKLSGQIVPFKVFREENRFTAVPLISQEERQATNLTRELVFDFLNNTVAPRQEGGNIEVMQNIILELRMQKLL